ncbi:tRNA synthetases class I catalytic domain [Trinorchestia longiramus]|nr:tRNA synthetases class I catalytic domain [Trinorchestia longiramus]
MTIKVLNTLTGKYEKLELTSNTIRWYICGPTVYDATHLGHARTYVTFDMIRSILENYFGYDVMYVMNITNIDDKIIAKANSNKKTELSVSFQEVIAKYENEFFEDMDQLNVKRPSVTVRVTEYVQIIKRFIERLEYSGYAYESNGSVYFDSQEFRNDFNARIFEKSDVDKNNLEKQAEDPVEGWRDPSVVKYDGEKKNPADFALWKRAKENEISYESRWGPLHGRGIQPL